jgi:hypothetical protein
MVFTPIRATGNSVMTVYVIVQLKMTDRIAYDRSKLVLMSFPDEAAFHAERIFRLSANRLAA